MAASSPPVGNFPNFFSFPGDSAEQGVTHEVVKGETLWELAGRYLGNPFRWPLIYEANQDQISDPDLIEPGQTFVIPGVGREIARVQGVVVVEGGVAEEQPVVVAEVVAPVTTRSRSSGRTVFFSAPTVRNQLEGAGPRVVAGDTNEMGRLRKLAVPYGFVYSAEWREAPGAQTEALGVLEDLQWAGAEGTARSIARKGEVVSISPTSMNGLTVGDLLQSFRIVREERTLGVVYRPTGILVVTEVSEGGISARVSSEYDRIRMGDRVRRAPDYQPRLGASPSPVRSDVSAVIVGFSEERPMQGLGARAFLSVEG